jgi:hypothetical protein
MGIFVQYAPYSLRYGDWGQCEAQFADRCLEVLAG